MKESTGSTEKLKYIRSLDGVRGLAAILVMWFHFDWGDSNLIYSIIKKSSVFGQTGVSLFFVLSGFLITRILLFNKITNREKFFSHFYIRRSLRIFPLYYLTLLLVFFIAPLLLHQPFISFSRQIYFWIYMQNFAMTLGWPNIGPSHFWSLAVEEHFYLFWPLLIYFLNIKNIKRAIGFLICLSLACRIILIHYRLEVFYFTFTNLDSLSLGALLAVLEFEDGFKKKFNKNLIKIILYFCTPLMLILWTLYGGKGNAVIQVVKPLLIFSFYYLLVFFVIQSKPGERLNTFFSNRLLIFSGKISYGLYVFHPFCFLILSGTILGKYIILNFISSFLLSYLIAIASFYLYEKRFLNLKKKY